MSIEYRGQLWTGKTSPAIRKALDETQRFAKLKLRANTPVKTGHLRASWDVNKSDRGLRITNSAKYAIYVELGTSRMAPRAMLARSLPDIEATFKQALARELGKSLGARVIAAVSGRGFGSAEQIGAKRANELARSLPTPSYERLIGRS